MRNGFTLIEMLLATVLSSLLMFALLAMLRGAARDRAILHAMQPVQQLGGVVDLLTWDLTNAREYRVAADGQSLDMTGSNGIASSSLLPNGRYVHIRYEIASGNLWRSQEYLDSANRDADYHELVAVGASSLSIQPASVDASAVPRQVRLKFVASGSSIDQDIQIK